VTTSQRRGIPGVWLAVAAGTVAAVLWGVWRIGLSFDPPLVILGIGGATLVAVGWTLYRVVEPLLRVADELPESEQVPARRRELEREKQAVLKAIREIENDYQMRKISDADHREMLARYRGRAMRLLGELDAGDNYAVLIEQELKLRLAAIDGTEPIKKQSPGAEPDNK
jgi:hypothetical protein